METTIYYTKSGRDYLLILELSLLWWIVAGGQPGFCKDNKRVLPQCNPYIIPVSISFSIFFSI